MSQFRLLIHRTVSQFRLLHRSEPVQATNTAYSEPVQATNTPYSEPVQATNTPYSEPVQATTPYSFSFSFCNIESSRRNALWCLCECKALTAADITDSGQAVRIPVQSGMVG